MPATISERHRSREARVLIIAPHGSYRTAPYIEAARRRGIEVLIASEGRHSLVSAYAQGLHLDFSDTHGALDVIREAVRHRSFAAIIGTDDTTTELASLAARQLGLSHNEPDAVRIARRKDLARARLSEAGIPVPSHVRVSPEEAAGGTARRHRIPLRSQAPGHVGKPRRHPFGY